jgi:hypothetical protein
MKSNPRSGGSETPFLWTRGIAARETVRYLDRNVRRPETYEAIISEIVPSGTVDFEMRYPIYSPLFHRSCRPSLRKSASPIRAI